MFEKVLAAAGFAVCLLLMLRMALGPARRYRFDAFWRGAFEGLRRRARAVRRKPRPPSDPDEAARREAERLIERARRARAGAEQDGNVIRPRAFDHSGRNKPPLH
jgi:hypothetical protein